MPDFTESELTDLANMLCGRVDALKEIATHKVPNAASLQKDIKALSTLDSKLRPYFTGKST